MLEVRGVAKSYHQVHALVDVDVIVRPGEIVGLLGPNGAGKTTLVSIVAGLVRADAGAVLVDGVDVKRAAGRARGVIGLAPQELGIYPTLTVRQNLQFFAELSGYRGADARRRADAIVVGLALTDKVDTVADRLSGGQKRRLHAGMALVGEPRLLLLDEPTAGADVETRAQLLDVVRARANEGAAVVYSTHYLHEIEQLDATVVILHRGRVLASGPCRELVAANAESVVEFSIGGEVSRISTPTPDEVAAAQLHAAAARGALVERIEIIRPSLETVYLAVVGSRYAPASETAS